MHEKPKWLKRPPTRQAASTVGAVGEKIRKTSEFCAGCKACIPNPNGLPGCAELIVTDRLVNAGDVTTEHIAKNASAICFELNFKLANFQHLKPQN